MSCSSEVLTAGCRSPSSRLRKHVQFYSQFCSGIILRLRALNFSTCKKYAVLRKWSINFILTPTVYIVFLSWPTKIVPVYSNTCTCINVYWCKLIFSPQLHQTTLVQDHRPSQRVIQMFKSTSLLMLTPLLPTSHGQGMVCQSPPPVMWLWQQPALHSLQCSGRMLGHIPYIAITLLGVAALLLNSLCNVSCFCWYIATPRHVLRPHKSYTQHSRRTSYSRTSFFWPSKFQLLPGTIFGHTKLISCF